MKFLNKEIKINKNTTTKIFSILFISLILIFNGFISIWLIGFDFSRVLTSEFWVEYSTLVASEVATIYILYILQKIKDLESDKIINLQDFVSDSRDKIYTLNEVDNVTNWLQHYNYGEKLKLFINAIDNKLNKINIEEKPEEECYDNISEFRKKILKARYKRQVKKYNKELEKYEFLKCQLDYANLDNERIKLLKTNKNIERVKELNKILNDKKYKFKMTKIKYEMVYWNKLGNNFIDKKKNFNSPYFHEKRILTKILGFMIFCGCIMTIFLSALIPLSSTGLTDDTALKIIYRLIMILWSAIVGIFLSKRIILGDYLFSLNNKKDIYNQMLYDLGIDDYEIIETEKKEQK